MVSPPNRRRSCAALYLEALGITRKAREMCSLMWGKYPHPQTIVPGGISTTISLQVFNEYQNRLFALMDHAKRMITLWNDISDFLYEADPGFPSGRYAPAQP